MVQKENNEYSEHDLKMREILEKNKPLRHLFSRIGTEIEVFFLNHEKITGNLISIDSFKYLFEVECEDGTYYVELRNAVYIKTKNTMDIMRKND